MTESSSDSETTTFSDLHEAHDAFFVPRFVVQLGDDEDGRFTESDGVITNLSVDTALDSATTFSFTVNYPWNAEYGRFEGLDWETFENGTTATIGMGYGDGDPVHLCRGYVTSVRPSFPAGDTPTVDVEGYGLLHLLTDPPEPSGDEELLKDWEDVRPHEVVRDVVEDREYPLSVDAEPVDVEARDVKQEDSQDDLRFLLELAERYAYELFVREETLVFQPTRYDDRPDVELRYGESLESFSPEVDTTDEVDRVEVRNWDAERGTEIVGTATREGFDGDDPSTETVRLSVRDEGEAQARAEALLANRLDGTVSGDGECVGLPELRPGVRLRIEGLTDRFSATYYVESAQHTFSNDGYRTSFSAKRREL